MLLFTSTNKSFMFKNFAINMLKLLECIFSTLICCINDSFYDLLKEENFFILKHHNIRLYSFSSSTSEVLFNFLFPLFFPSSLSLVVLWPLIRSLDYPWF